jgi:dienelactone hydrolase
MLGRAVEEVEQVIVSKLHWRSVAMAVVLTAAAAACAVVPSYPRSESTFGGFPVSSSIPAHARGVVYVFHGTAGGVGFADRLETVDMLNHLTAAGYGFVVTESTDRTAKQWDNDSLSLTANPDLARLVALHASLVADRRITSTTPIFAIGMSQGAGFASVFARAFHDAGYPLGAIAPSHGQIPAAVRAAGGPGVPIFTALGANDATVPNDRVVRQIADLQSRGLAALDHPVVVREHLDGGGVHPCLGHLVACLLQPSVAHAPEAIQCRFGAGR